MPGYKRYRGTYRTYKRRRPYAKPASIDTMKRVAKRVVMSNIETKERLYDYTNVGGTYGSIAPASFASVSNGGTVAALLTGITGGTAGNQRIGGQVELKGVRVNMAVQNGDSSNYVRVILCAYKRGQTFQASAVTTNTFLQALLSGALTYYNPIDTDIFTVYYDKTRYIKATPLDGSTTTAVPGSTTFSKYIPLRKKTMYNVSQTATNEIFLVMISDSGAIAHPGAVNGYVKLWYTDA